MAEVKTLSSQQAMSLQIMAPAATSRVTVTSIQQAQQLIASRETELLRLDSEWNAVKSSADKWDRLSQTASSETLRAQAGLQRDRFLKSADVVMREIIRVEDELSFFQSEFERLRAATGLPSAPKTPTEVAQEVARQAAQAARNQAVAAAQGRTPPAVGVSKLPFGMTTNQLVTFVGGGALILLAASHLFPPKPKA